MRVNIINQSGPVYNPDTKEASVNEGRVITVFLTSWKSGQSRRFRCSGCGNILFEYGSEIGLVIDSSLNPDGSVPITVKCKNCRIKCRILVI